ncbi:hypothetical protein M758_12G082300 [Ceratodon purpureus]|nr:hypothetical protein M758_12G082300 [Ceratodon purpureus]
MDNPVAASNSVPGRTAKWRRAQFYAERRNGGERGRAERKEGRSPVETAHGVKAAGGRTDGRQRLIKVTASGGGVAEWRRGRAVVAAGGGMDGRELATLLERL